MDHIFSTTAAFSSPPLFLGQASGDSEALPYLKQLVASENREEATHHQDTAPPFWTVCVARACVAG